MCSANDVQGTTALTLDLVNVVRRMKLLGFNAVRLPFSFTGAGVHPAACRPAGLVHFLILDSSSALQILHCRHSPCLLRCEKHHGAAPESACHLLISMLALFESVKVESAKGLAD